MNKTNWMLVSLVAALMMLSFICGVAVERDRQYSLARQNDYSLAKYYCDHQGSINASWTEWYALNKNKTLNQLDGEL